MDSNQLSNLEAGALDRLLKKHKTPSNLEIFQRHTDTVPSTGKNIFRFGALNPNNPDKSRAQIVVDEAGEELDPKALGEREAKLFFGGDFWPWYQYSYSVKFVCGVQPAADGCCCLPGVRTGIYATEINIHNYQAYGWAWLQKSVLPVILAGTPQGREPRAVLSRGRDQMLLPAGFATMDDCCRINELLFDSAPPAGQPLNVGFLEIVSNVELKVTAVYTATDLDSKSVSIEVEEIPFRLKYPYYYPFPIQAPPVPAGSATA
ncbi:MAG: hypothetical protein M3O15_10155 [Acidobacteriota bacterium]|nr:hypothetical protein [Acidobacteriota bacterium]